MMLPKDMRPQHCIRSYAMSSAMAESLEAGRNRGDTSPAAITSPVLERLDANGWRLVRRSWVERFLIRVVNPYGARGYGEACK